mmetsp:Transcript_18372/g.29386  ORF Transcript_18372/g.29386 Transcript_18372/m.29386 type:complete len:213 (+) Transcript_18372:423-1061(+)
MCLVCATTDLQKLRISPETLHAVFGDVAVATHYLHCSVGHVLAHDAAVELYAIGIQTVAYSVEVQVLGRLVDVATASLVLRVGLGDEPLHLPEGVQRRAEGLALLRVPVHVLDTSSCDSKTHCRQGYPLDLQVAHHAHGGFALYANQVGSWNPAVLKDELCCHGCPHAALVLDLLSQGKALGTFLDQEERDLLCSRTGTGIDQVGITRGLAV